MLHFIDIEHDIEPLVACVEAFGSAAARADRARLLGQIREHLEKLRAVDEKSTEELGESYEGVSGSGGGDAEAERATLASREDESATAKMLLPRILSLQRYLTGTSLNDDPEAHRLLQKAVNIAVAYVAGYQNLGDHLIKLGAEQQSTAREVLRARPVEGDIDHEALTREVIARFPKILAALAN